MNKPKLPVAQYGIINDLSVSRDTEKNLIFLTGTGNKSGQWVHLTTQRALHQLWFSLTHALFPEKAKQVTSMAQTAVMSVPQPGLTTFFEAHYNADTHLYEVIGWIGDSMWTFQMVDEKARRLWTTLDLLIYPAGWEGSTTTHHPPTNGHS